MVFFGFRFIEDGEVITAEPSDAAPERDVPAFAVFFQFFVFPLGEFQPDEGVGGDICEAVAF